MGWLPALFILAVLWLILSLARVTVGCIIRIMLALVVLGFLAAVLKGCLFGGIP
ncbi:MAG TPA: hypothetical protein GXX40_07400 [Firmicutes bacterium]|nr:hypothetical protein [Bacillota bacterium]